MASNTAEEETVSPVGCEIEWDSETCRLTEFENGSGLPRVVKLDGDLPQGLNIYKKQPILLYARTNKTHVGARTIYHDKNGPYYEVGQTLLIPDDFDGWFEMVPQDFDRGAYFHNIQEVADVMPGKIFTRTNIQAIRVVTEDGEQIFKERKISAGTVLRVLGSFAAKWRTTAEKGVMKNKSKEWVTMEMKYLKCVDIDEKEVLLPFDAQGKFNAVYQKDLNDSRCVFRLKDIVSNFELPLKVCLLYGKAPTMPCIFTGMLNLKKQWKEDCIIASTILNKRNVLIEIPVSLQCCVYKATKEADYCEKSTYKDAQKLCEKYALKFASMIKLSPELDTNQQTIQHIPTQKRKTRDESLRMLDLITNISITDDEPCDQFMESHTDSVQSIEKGPTPIKKMLELKELQSRESHFC
ncbi:hypothetical protein ACJMK2_042734 [Sinanodonta woodiana]|uniref:CABIT domain-containing protein n=1 Tax=Sinanodonta woodiana TaxID=1069815 RepID=A0ABD3WA83_SINWO